MAAVELLESFVVERSSSPLRLVGPAESWRVRQGPGLAQRRRARAKVRQIRQRVALGLVVACALAILSVPGAVWGQSGGAGVSSDLASGSSLAAGESYVVQPGDTLSSLAREINPQNPALVRRLLVRELGSSVVVTGEHVLIP